MTDALGRPGAVLVLGGGSEIGLAIASRLVERGAEHVILAGRDEAVMRARAEAALPVTDRISTLVFDAADPASHRAAIDRAFAEHGDVDVAVIAFGVLGDQPEYERDAEAAARDASVNFAGTVSAGLLVAEHLREQGHGTLVVLSSVAGQRPRRENYVYGAAKAGIDAFARGLDAALAGSGAWVMVVRPGFVKTRMTSHLAPRVLPVTPGRVADAVVRGLDRGSKVVWVPWTLRWMFAVLRVLPEPLFRRMSG